jgi:hypothetical protein
MNLAVDAVDDKPDPLPELVGEPLVDVPANDGGPRLFAMKVEAFHRALLSAPRECSAHGHNVAAVAEPTDGGLKLLGRIPHSGFGLFREPEACQRLEPADPQYPVKIRSDLAGLRPQVEDVFLCLRHHGPVDPSEALGRDLGLELRSQFPIRLRAKLERCQLLGAEPHTIGDVVLRDDQILTEIIVPPDNDVAMRVTGIKVIDRDPIESSSQILFHLPHHVADEGTQVRELLTILRCHDEAELVAILSPAFSECLAVSRIGLGPIEPTAFAAPGRAVALQVADMRIGRAAANLQPYDPRLEDGPPHALAAPAHAGPELQSVSRRLASTDAATAALSRASSNRAVRPVSASLSPTERRTTSFGDRDLDLVHERAGTMAGASAPVSRARPSLGRKLLL